MPKLASYVSMTRRIRPVKATPKVWNYVKYRALPRRALTSCARTSPQIASLLLTKRCNMSCSFCNVGSFMHDKSTTWQSVEADLEKVRRIFASPLFSRTLLVDLLGGEPLLVKELGPIVAFLFGTGHLTNMATNGVLLADRIEELKDAGISRVSVSVYEDNRAILERELLAINRVFPVHASMVLFRGEVERAPEKIIQTARFLKDAGCLDLRFWIYRPIGENPDPGRSLRSTILLCWPCEPKPRRRSRASVFGPSRSNRERYVNSAPSSGREWAATWQVTWASAAGRTSSFQSPAAICSTVVRTKSSTTLSSSRCASSCSTLSPIPRSCADPATS